MKRFTYFNPHKTALTCALVLALSSLIFILPMAAMMSFVPMSDENGLPVNARLPGVMLLIMPVLYFLFGYLGTAFSAWIYNKVAKFTGGIVCEISEQQDS